MPRNDLQLPELRPHVVPKTRRPNSRSNFRWQNRVHYPIKGLQLGSNLYLFQTRSFDTAAIAGCLQRRRNWAAPLRTSYISARNAHSARPTFQPNSNGLTVIMTRVFAPLCNCGVHILKVGGVPQNRALSPKRWVLYCDQIMALAAVILLFCRVFAYIHRHCSTASI